MRSFVTARQRCSRLVNAEMAKLLLDRGADTKVKDTFYGATAMSWAIDGKHVQVVRLMLEKNTDEIEDVLLAGVRESNAELLKVALDRGGIQPQTMTAALAMSSVDEK